MYTEWGPHHRVLRQVIIGASGNCVELHQVFKVGYLSLYPFLEDRMVKDEQ